MNFKVAENHCLRFLAMKVVIMLFYPAILSWKKKEKNTLVISTSTAS